MAGYKKGRAENQSNGLTRTPPGACNCLCLLLPVPGVWEHGHPPKLTAPSPEGGEKRDTLSWFGPANPTLFLWIFFSTESVGTGGFLAKSLEQVSKMNLESLRVLPWKDAQRQNSWANQGVLSGDKWEYVKMGCKEWGITTSVTAIAGLRTAEAAIARAAICLCFRVSQLYNYKSCPWFSLWLF